jgi:hypothetical protein
MMDPVRTRIARLRRPAYTGPRRCWPCTGVNLVILAVLALLIGAISPPIGAVIAVLGVAAIAVRGYLIPYTPRFAPALVAAVPGLRRWFDHPHPQMTGSVGAAAQRDAASDLEDLLGAGLLVEADGVIAPSAAFASAWDTAIRGYRGTTLAELAAEAASVSPARSARPVRMGGDEWVALSTDATHALEETWLTRPAVIAELAAVSAATTLTDDPTRPLQIARVCRMFLTECPACATPLEQGTEVDCCGGFHGTGEIPADTLVCPSCEVRVATLG